MAQSPLAAVSDLAAWVGQSIPDADPRAEAVLSAASTLVRSEVDPDTAAGWGDPDIPDEVSLVVVQVAARIWLNPAGLNSESIDDYTRRWGDVTESGAYLTAAERDILSRFRTKPKGLWTLGVTRGDTTADQYLEVTGSEPMPHLPNGS